LLDYILLTDTKAIIFDPEYKELGPLGLVAVYSNGMQVFWMIECGQLLLHFLTEIWHHQLDVQVMGEDVIFVKILGILHTDVLKEITIQHAIKPNCLEEVTENFEDIENQKIEIEKIKN